MAGMEMFRYQIGPAITRSLRAFGIEKHISVQQNSGRERGAKSIDGNNFRMVDFVITFARYGLQKPQQGENCC
jgi:hypothetical protein